MRYHFTLFFFRWFNFSIIFRTPDKRKLFAFQTCDSNWAISFVVWVVRNPIQKVSLSCALYRRRYSTSKELYARIFESDWITDTRMKNIDVIRNDQRNKISTKFTPTVHFKVWPSLTKHWSEFYLFFNQLTYINCSNNEL